MTTNTKPKPTILRVLTAVLSVQISVQLVLQPVAFALEIQLKSDVKLREHSDQSMERVGLLKRGTIVEIPDEFVVHKNGKPDLELTLNNWLREAGQMRTNSDRPGRYTFDGEKNEYFFPIRVTKPAKGSTVAEGHQNNQHFIALKFLARRGSALVVSDDAPITASRSETVATAPKAAAPKPSVDVQTRMEGSPSCATGLCSKPSDASLPVRKLISDISPALAAANTKSAQLFRRTQNDLGHVHSNFEKSCGFPLSEFTPIVKSRAEQAGVPPEILMALMTQESSGRCYVLNSETDRTQSVGLFQINSRSAKYPRCTNEQKNILRNLGHASRLATGPRCLENPIVNLDESIRLLTSMKHTLTSGSSGFNARTTDSTDLWRMVVSSYNGGPRWVLQAKKDLEEFNRKNGTNLQAGNWEDLRLFYMRRWLNRNQQIENFGSVVNGRSKENSVANLSYAENVVGRNATSDTRPSLAVAWRATVRD